MVKSSWLRDIVYCWKNTASKLPAQRHLQKETNICSLKKIKSYIYTDFILSNNGVLDFIHSTNIYIYRKTLDFYDHGF